MKSIKTESYQVLIALLKQKRQDQGVTQDDLAKKIGLDQTFVSKYETGERRLDVIELRRVCEALDMDFIEFISEFEKEDSK
jgi:transcriptional regulator with XRE-family HTH domain